MPKTARIVLVLLIVGMYLFIPITALASTSELVVITASPFLGNGTCVYDFTVIVISDYEIQLDWTPGNGTGTYIIGAYGRWPVDATDGFVVYNGNSSHTSHWLDVDIRILSDLGLYYKAYNDLGGVYSSCFASGSVTGGGEDVSVMGIGLIGLLPLGLMALSMAWFRITGKDGWPIMVGAGLAWLALGAYGFSKSATAWDIYQIIGSVSMMMLVICILLSYQGSQAHNEAVIKSQTKVIIQPPRDFGERYNDFEKRSGLKSKSERRSESDARLNDKLKKRLG